MYDGRASESAAGLKPSPRGELEITDLNRCYLDREELAVEVMGCGYAWPDTGTHASLLEASQAGDQPGLDDPVVSAA